ncbi:sigma-70 family RNA polymerase sigma factor [Clostridium botulinum]|uniref:sigma-70 family RNA polymerase sigma factor n=1 Tax=Clostridium botulinum TaxID=1491 RepID=UPI0007748E9B|nr:sigma-70 family RNA polymerase sigma factor [Clostridium botulinum]MBY6931870.1 sigma-70 family RNA polymerase sigma factor [Clostridium botulinum]NFG20564.1 sigma-70 family RNA polymerase sigma factor [Clostridium botulinum]NFO81122.1 sigma-70 family RNA polymerase sigma factor [Clostridium botulinum]
MRKYELIKTTKNLLENISNMREQLKNELELIPKIQKVKINILFRILNNLDSEHQQLIAYKHFEKKKYSEIAVLLRVDARTITRRLNKIYLKVGRLIYGFEDELVDMLDEALLN